MSGKSGLPMNLDEFIREMQRRQWVLWGSREGRHVFICRHDNCPSSVVVLDDKMGKSALARPCKLPHTDPIADQAVVNYHSLVEILRRRRQELGLSQDDVEYAAGLSIDHIGKAESGERSLTLPTFTAWANTLGFDFRLAPAPVPDQVIKVIQAKAGNTMKVPLD